MTVPSLCRAGPAAGQSGAASEDFQERAAVSPGTTQEGRTRVPVRVGQALREPLARAPTLRQGPNVKCQGQEMEWGKRRGLSQGIRLQHDRQIKSRRWSARRGAAAAEPAPGRNRPQDVKLRHLRTSQNS